MRPLHNPLKGHCPVWGDQQQMTQVVLAVGANRGSLGNIWLTVQEVFTEEGSLALGFVG